MKKLLTLTALAILLVIGANIADSAAQTIATIAANPAPIASPLPAIESDVPLISPEQVTDILAIIKVLAEEYGYGGYFALFIFALGLIGVISGAAAKYLLNADREVPWWLGWLPALSSLWTVNQAVGKNAVIKPKVGLLKRILTILLIFAFLLYSPMASISFAQDAEIPATTCAEKLAECTGTDCPDCEKICEAKCGWVSLVKDKTFMTAILGGAIFLAGGIVGIFTQPPQ